MAAAVSALLALLVASEVLAAEVHKILCVFDPGGATGDLYTKMKRYQNQATSWGVDFDLKAYTDESVAAADFRNKKCDAVLLTGVTGKEFNRKTYSLEALGLFPSYDNLKKAIAVLAKPKAGKLNRAGIYETVGIYPAGAVYLHVRDREMSTLAALAGRSLATIDGDIAAETMVREVGATPKFAGIGNFASMFNNGYVDACYGPATAYGPLELYKGVGERGGVLRIPVAQLTFQLFIRSDEFPRAFGDLSRSYVSQEFAAMLAVIRKAESTIKPWVDVENNAAEAYALLEEVRARLVAQGVYNSAVVTLGERLSESLVGSKAGHTDHGWGRPF